MKHIPLSQGEFAIVDDCDYDEISKHKWFVDNQMSGKKYAARWSGGRKNRKHHCMHRMIIGARTGYDVDHINGNGLDNRRSNLRECLHRNNVHNARMRSDNTSGYKGVSRAKRPGTWRAYLILEKKYIHLGIFDNLEDAARAYNKAAKKYHGQYANLNRIKTG